MHNLYNALTAIDASDTNMVNKLVMLGAARSLKNERNDCAVRALAIACDVSYDEAHSACAAAGRKWRSGIRLDQIIAAGRKLGFEIRLFNDKEASDFADALNSNRVPVGSITLRHPAKYPGVWKDGRSYILSTARHVAPCVNGAVIDEFANTKRRVLEILVAVPLKQE